ncbi:hypothetical protein NDU88_006344 [Pleurodeles waltl]|uniref:Uncharacterized protein n=1 Tax=Pleurodeles waltl TaxID=8319 RepID=A0AAV7TDM5_PLEWA|nr:hypothetical protein NDU88_006344 [Pleurodeles waltl]
MTSEEEFPGEETEIDVGRRVEESEKPERDLRSKTEERETCGSMPISPYPRGTQERIGIPEITSEEEFPGEETEIDVGRRVEESEKPEGDLRWKTEEREMPGEPGEPGEPRDGETGTKKATNEDRRRLETGDSCARR